uniref:Uncharacterized protein n=1 Tax=Arundo donax TaxID=35708 RepID=A0A0A8Z016_ARUDO
MSSTGDEQESYKNNRMHVKFKEAIEEL